MATTTTIQCYPRQMADARENNSALHVQRQLRIAKSNPQNSDSTNYPSPARFVVLPNSQSLLGKRVESVKMFVRIQYASYGTPFSDVSVQPGAVKISYLGALTDYYSSVSGKDVNSLKMDSSGASAFQPIKFPGSGTLYERHWLESTLLTSSSLPLVKLLQNGGVFEIACDLPVVYVGNPDFLTTVVDMGYFFDEDNNPIEVSPYFSVQASDTLFYHPGNLVPRNFASPRAATVFSWSYLPDSGNFGDSSSNPIFPQQGSQFRYRKKGASGYTSIDIPGRTNKYTLPAGTFDDFSEYEWSVVVQSNGGAGQASEWITLRTTDTLPTCVVLTPSNAYIERSAETEMTWSYTVSTGLSQYAFDAQYKTTNGNWTFFANHIVQSGKRYLIPGGTLPSGNLLLRIRGYNSNDAPGEWSEPVNVTVVGAPNAPEVRVDSVSPRPQVSWASEEQTGYQVRAGTYQSGQLAGSQRTFKIPEYLQDGQTTIGVRISNEFGYWSEWSETSIIIENDPLPVGTLIADAIKDSVINLTIGSPGTVNYIFRDGRLIGKTYGATFSDVMVSGRATYQVLKTNGDHYVYTPVVNASVSINGRLLAGEDGEWFDVGTRYGATPELAQSDVANVSYIQYAGRRFPVAERGAGETRTIAFECVFRNGDPRIKKLEALLGSAVRYKDETGLCLQGFMETCEWVRNRRFVIASCSIVQVDAEEEVTYDV